MKVYQDLNKFIPLNHAVVTSGFFDGVHKGHQKILARLTELAQKDQGASVVITFWPHPKQVLRPDLRETKLLSSLEEKIYLLERSRIDHLLIIPFTKEFSEITSDRFVKNILIQTIGTKKLVIGYDHKFGKNREGGFDYLKGNASLFGFKVEEISKQEVDNIGISSTLIRQALSEGRVKEAATYLGRDYSLSGIVVQGKHLGRTLGYPTANIKPPEIHKLIPKDGIYAVRVKYKEKLFKGMMSIGFNPTVNGTERTLEVNIFDFDQTIYGEELEVYFADYLRDELNFENLEMLVHQLHRDKENTLKALK